MSVPPSLPRSINENDLKKWSKTWIFSTSEKINDHFSNDVIFSISSQVARVESQGWDRVKILLEFVPPRALVAQTL